MLDATGLPRLGVNIDHIATLRQLRNTPYPSLVDAARECEQAGANQITVHLREDRRHIQDDDVFALRKALKIPLNLEMAVAPSIVKIALKVRPDWACLVPEKRQEVTTEGGLNIKKNRKAIEKTIHTLRKAGICVSLFIEPELADIELSKKLGAHAVELHTGRFAGLTQLPKDKINPKAILKEVSRIQKAALRALELGINAHAGHGLDFQNVRVLAELTDPQGGFLIEEYNIGHALICRSTIVGIKTAVREMLSAIRAP